MTAIDGPSVFFVQRFNVEYSEGTAKQLIVSFSQFAFVNYLVINKNLLSGVESQAPQEEFKCKI